MLSSSSLWRYFWYIFNGLICMGKITYLSDLCRIFFEKAHKNYRCAMHYVNICLVKSNNKSTKCQQIILNVLHNRLNVQAHCNNISQQLLWMEKNTSD